MKAATADVSGIAQLSDPTTLERGGGKWLGLCNLERAEARVPVAFCIEAGHFREFATHLRLHESTIALEESHDEELPLHTKKLRARIREARIPEPLRVDILTAYHRLAASSVAVRSSATAEDLADASFAGQYDSLLDVSGDDALLDAVVSCWASTFSDRAVASRRRLGISERDVAMAVVVQEMVSADCSGVAFTRHPLEERPVILVEACKGLGEALVSGRLDPERFEIARQGPSWRHLSGGQDTGLGTTRLLAMRDEFLRLETALGFPADLEWSWQGDHLFLLQARPISTQVANGDRPAPGGLAGLRGTPAAPGVAEGRARVLLDADQDELEPGDVLVTPFTDPAWTRHFSRACGLVMEHGGLLCHGAILARECGIPAVVGLQDATQRIEDGQRVRVDGDAGYVEIQ